jgi:hypothetical protein
MTSLGTFSSCLICNVDVAESAMTCPAKNARFFPEAPLYVAISNAVAKKPPFTSSKIKAPQPSPLHEF